MEPRYTKGTGHWQNLFAVLIRFHYTVEPWYNNNNNDNDNDNDNNNNNDKNELY